ncbi:hypothetical protein SAMN05661096_02335 [Marivirga sericea]|uniref:DUF2064 domain-containing protein n=1 Tax=Marivirga sericea TaxID=1028 RepID=A0A1X7K3U3_9BACT|nr:DUF2064 domain-containing protein [Marivirga sericea]SMG35373.1 hypothetical protein SAMN05661096_02335 [Marivirga sericea]
MGNNKNIALIFFSRTSAGEAKYKSWFKEKIKNSYAASLLINKAESAVQKSGIPFYHFHEKNQKGNNFGERIANAYQEVFDMGYEQVISVGNDCPDLENINWRQISVNLSKGKTVLGPDTRGGAYLIGIQKKYFDKGQFEALSWQKNTLYQELSLLCEVSTKLVELNQYRDINSSHDIRLLSNVKKSIDKFRQLLFQLLKPFKVVAIEFQIVTHDFYIFKDSPLRAPPIK